MAPKKDKKKEEAAAAKNGNGCTEVDKTFLELQLAESNRKVARLRSALEEYEHRNEELQQAFDTLDEDRADIIAYLKKMLNVKSEENNELREKVKGLEETRSIETSQFKVTVTELERNFSIMKDQLTSENKLLASKLNTLEEFRAIRDDLMRKFEKQEQDFQDQELKYKRIIYETEKKFVIGKDKLKKEMEARLLQLAQDFQDATELRIAASTHRVIRENIAINSELDNILATQTKLAQQNEKFKESERIARIGRELAEEERNKAIGKNVVQLKCIDQLTTALEELKKEKATYQKTNDDLVAMQEKVQKLTTENENLNLKIQTLEQNLHVKLRDQKNSFVEISKIAKGAEKLKSILNEAAIAIQGALKLDQFATADSPHEVIDRQGLLSRLLDIVSQYRETQKEESVDTISAVYEEGDLGFIPKITVKKSSISTATSLSKDKKSLHRDVHSSTVTSVASTEVVSLKTIPSLKVMPISSKTDSTIIDSVQSLSESEQATECSTQEPGHDIVTQLEASKLEIKKSIMKDLARTHINLKSQLRVNIESDTSLKSVTIVESSSDEKFTDIKLPEEIESSSSEIVEVQDMTEMAAKEKDIVADDETKMESEKEEKVEEQSEEVAKEETKAEVVHEPEEGLGED